MGKLVFLKLERGDFHQGFRVSLDMAEEGRFPHITGVNGFLRPAPEILESYKDWQTKYCALESDYRRQRLYFTENPPEREESERESHLQACYEAAEKLKTDFQNWLSCAEFRPIETELLTDLNRADGIRLMLQTEDEQLRKLPWELWSFFQRFPYAELGISPSSYYGQRQIAIAKKVRILAILGNSDGINLQEDRKVLESLPLADVCFLVEPTRQQFQKLWEEHWDILFFAGHSSSKDGDKGYIYINKDEKDKLEIGELEETLRVAIDNGLKLAIFNSCDGLGLARQLEKLHIPQVIVMREPIPDKFAQEFLKYFLTDLAHGTSLYTSVGRARRKLRELLQIDREFPGASWSPVICQNPAAKDFVWPASQPEASLRWRFPIKMAIASGVMGGLVLVVAFMSTHLWREDKSLNTPSSPPSPQLSRPNPPQNFAEVQNVPTGLFSYGGSTTWAPIRGQVDREIEEIWSHFKLRYTEPTADAPGSATGIKMLLDGKLAFSQSSRELKPEEYKKAKDKGFTLKEIPVAIDGIAIAVNPKLRISSLTVAQLKDIYTGRMSNWQQVGGPDLPIKPYSRRLEDSGTIELFVEKVLDKKNFGTSVQFIATTTQALRQVAVDPGGIYYASAPEVVDQCTIKPLPLRLESTELVNPYQGSPVPPAQCPKQHNQVNAAAFQSGKYPLTRKLFVIIKQNGQIEQQAGEAYANLLLTEQGQKLINIAGFVNYGMKIRLAPR